MKVAVVVPTYNEKGNIEFLVDRLMSLEITDLKVIVVDDNSPDGTGKVADELAGKYKKRLKVIHRIRKMGLGNAYKAGFRKAFKMKIEGVITMDADLSHDPKEILVMIKKFENSQVVIGSRHIKKGKIKGLSFWRLGLSSGAQWLCQKLAGIRVKDATSGFRGYQVEALRKIYPQNIKSEGYSFLIEAIYRAQKLGLTIKEIPIVYQARNQGNSKVSRMEIFKAVLTVFRLGKENLID